MSCVHRGPRLPSAPWKLAVWAAHGCPEPTPPLLPSPTGLTGTHSHLSLTPLGSTILSEIRLGPAEPPSGHRGGPVAKVCPNAWAPGSCLPGLGHPVTSIGAACVLWLMDSPHDIYPPLTRWWTFLSCHEYCCGERPCTRFHVGTRSHCFWARTQEWQCWSHGDTLFSWRKRHPGPTAAAPPASPPAA